MKTAIRDNNPVVIFEDKLMYQDKAPVPEEEYLIPFGEANVKREGATSPSSPRRPWCRWPRRRRKFLNAEGIEAEVIDPRTIVPLDEKTLLEA
jgi:pyruvate/2-oxoglutarate/acetoin dehydrogenase E1 component